MNGSIHHKFSITFFLIFILSITNAQRTRQQNRDSLFVQQDSRNGYILPVQGQIHILVIFAEVLYDKETDPCPPEGTKGWPAHSLPVWKNQLFDPYPSKHPQAKISKFFYEASFGNFIVTGDYLVDPSSPGKPVQIKASEKVSVQSILQTASKFSQFQTANKFGLQDFDRWTMTHTGHEKITPSIDNPLKYDHVMIIIRNSNYPSNLSGWTAARSPGTLFGYESDTYSFFCTHELLPMNILLHEFSHMLFGGNNLHAGGSHSKKAGYSYFPHIQGGWGMMGAAWKSFLTINAWERRRLGWKPDVKQFEISTLDSTGTYEIPADLDAENSLHAGIYLLRDFVTTGDAIRIKLPYIPQHQFQQWLWIENHQTAAFNNSEFDVFQYQYADCMDNATPGIYVYMQIDKNELTGRNIFEGYADYLRPLPANGLWDFIWEDTTMQNPWCINNNFYHPHELKAGMENPFSGTHEMELVFGDYNKNGKIEIEEYRVPAIRKEGKQFLPKLPVLGASEHAFTPNGKNLINIGTNPSTASIITSVTAGNELNAGQPPNNRAVYLNGISIELLNKQAPVPGAIYVRVTFDDYIIRNNIRWCADSIILQNANHRQQTTLIIDNKSQLHIDRGLSPTFILHPDTLQGQILFTKPTVFIVGQNSTLHVKPKSTLRISNGSTLIISDGASLILDEKARLLLSGSSRIILMKGANYAYHKKSKIKITSGSKIIDGKFTIP